MLRTALEKASTCTGFLLGTAGAVLLKEQGVRVDEVPRRPTEQRPRRRNHCRQQSWRGGRRGNRGPRLRLAVDSAVFALFFFLLARVRVAAADEAVDIRPAWMPLEGQHGDPGASVAEIFRSSEVLQIYHLQV